MEGFPEEVAFEQRCEGSEEASYADLKDVLQGKETKGRNPVLRS